MLQDLCEMIREKRRLEVAALAADNAVLRQSLAIWERFKVYPTSKTMLKIAAQADKPAGNSSAIIMSVLNGEPLSATDVKKAVAATGAKMSKATIYHSLKQLTKCGKLQRTTAKVRLPGVLMPRSVHFYRKSNT